MSVSKIINKIVFSDIEPENPYVLWMIKDGEHYNFKYFQDGLWQPILVTKEELEALIETSQEIREYIEQAYIDVQNITEEVLEGLSTKVDTDTFNNTVTAINTSLSERLVAKPLPEYSTEVLVDTLYGENSQGIYSIELDEGEQNTYPANKFTLEVLQVNNYTCVHRMYFDDRVASRYKNEGVEWSPWVLVGDNLSLYLTSDSAQSTYATLSQLGNIDNILDILNGDLEEDIQIILDNMAGV